MAIELRTERLRLRPFAPAGRVALHRIWTHPDVRRFLWDDRVIDLATVDGVIAASAASFAAEGFGHFALCEREPGGGALVGSCGLHRARPAAEPELLYSLEPACWGRGLAAEAARADVPNAASVRLMERLGMRREGESVENGLRLVTYALAGRADGPLPARESAAPPRRSSRRPSRSSTRCARPAPGPLASAAGESMRSRPCRLLLLLACLLVSPASPARAAGPEGTAFSLTVRGEPCSALLVRPADAHALLVLAHGQVMDIHHPVMEGISDALARRGIATLRFNFPYAEAKREQADRPPLLTEAIRVAVGEAEQRRGTLPLVVGGKSLGALAMARAVREGIVSDAQGLVILTYPLHAPGRPSGVNARTVDGLTLPVLFVQGNRDALADLVLMNALVEKIGENATLEVVEGADHAFAPPKGSPLTQDQIYDEVAGAVAAFAVRVASPKGE